MKSLFINRHAKSSWDHTNIKDFDRPLNERGFSDAPEMGERLNDRNEGIEHVVSSPANRAITTAKLLAEKLGLSVSDIEEIPGIYHAGYSTLLEIVNGFNNRFDKVIMFGHNPGFTDLVNYLTGEFISNIPTCGICKISFDTNDWNEVSGNMGNLIYFDYPKNY